MSKFAMVPRKVAEFHEDFNAITLDLLKKIQQQRNPEAKVVSDVADLLFQWSFECKCIIQYARPLHFIINFILHDLYLYLYSCLLLCSWKTDGLSG